MAKVKVKLFGVYRMDTHLPETTLEAEKLSDLLKGLHAYILERAPETRMRSGSCPRRPAVKEGTLWRTGSMKTAASAAGRATSSARKRPRRRSTR